MGLMYDSQKHVVRDLTFHLILGCIYMYQVFGTAVFLSHIYINLGFNISVKFQSYLTSPELPLLCSFIAYFSFTSTKYDMSNINVPVWEDPTSKAAEINEKVGIIIFKALPLLTFCLHILT